MLAFTDLTLCGETIPIHCVVACISISPLADVMHYGVSTTVECRVEWRVVRRGSACSSSSMEAAGTNDNLRGRNALLVNIMAPTGPDEAEELG